MASGMGNEVGELKDFAMEMIRQCGEKALSYYGKGKHTMKFDENLVTEAELDLSDYFRDQLKKRFPEHSLFPDSIEENGYTHEEKRYLWIFDPLDGVANFQAGIPLWGISVALFENYWPLFGIFHMAATGDLFRADAGAQAFWGDQQIAVSDQERISDETLLFTFSRFHQHYRTAFPGKVRNLGCTGAHLCYVAMGRAEAAVIANESYRELAAASVIVRSAGGRIYRMDGSEFFLGEYLEEGKSPEHLIVAPPKTHLQFRKYLERI